MKKKYLIEYPYLVEEWNFEKNGDLNIEKLTFGSNKKVWWKCDKGDDHEWKNTINNRTNGNGCPYCSGKKISKTNNLAFVNPKLAKEWHPIKNGNLRPNDVMPFSQKSSIS